MEKFNIIKILEKKIFSMWEWVFSPKTVVIEKSLEAMKSMGMGKEVV